MKKVLLGSVLATTLFASNGAVFAQRTETNVTQKDETQKLDTDLKLPENGGRDGKVPNNKSTQKSPSLTRDASDRQKAWGFSYIPNALGTNGEVALNEREPQDFSLNVYGPETQNDSNIDENIHIGVKNKTRQKNSWTLQAKLTSDFQADEKQVLETQNPLTGATFKLKGTDAKENKVDTQNKLENLVESELQGFSSGDKEINTSQNAIMTGANNIVHNATYDLAFTSAELNVRNTRRVPVGQFKTQITWTLAQVPGAGVGGPAA